MNLRAACELYRFRRMPGSMSTHDRARESNSRRADALCRLECSCTFQHAQKSSASNIFRLAVSQLAFGAECSAELSERILLRCSILLFSGLYEFSSATSTTTVHTNSGFFSFSYVCQRSQLLSTVSTFKRRSRNHADELFANICAVIASRQNVAAFHPAVLHRC